MLSASKARLHTAPDRLRKNPGGEEVAEQQAARHNAQQRNPCRCTPAEACQYDERDDVGQSRFDAG